MTTAPLRWLPLLALAACTAEPDPLPPRQTTIAIDGQPGATGQPGVGGGGQAGAAGQAGVSGSGQAGAGGEAGVGPSGQSGAAGQADVGPGGQAGAGGETVVGPGGQSGAGGEAGVGGGGCQGDQDCVPEGLCRACTTGSYACPVARCDGGLCQETAASCEQAPDCAPVDAGAVGGCDLPLGWRWDGQDCALVAGCSCEGSGCDELPPDKSQCLALRAGCVPAGLPCEGKPCGAPCSPCPPWEKCEAAPYRCDGQGSCVESPGACPSCVSAADCIVPPPRQCTGAPSIPYEVSCEGGACVSSAAECPSVSCEDTAVGVWAVPGCTFEFFGFAWQEGACTEMYGCGVDNPEALYSTWDQCAQAHEKCPARVCKSVKDCPSVLNCPVCSDGSFGCPAAQCAGGHCVYHPPHCP